MLKKSLVFLLILCLLCLTACTASAQQDFTVVASFYPLYIAALNVIGDAPGVRLTMMAPPDTGCLHDYQLRPQDMAALERCDLFIVNGGGLEAFLDNVMAKYPGLALCTASDGVDFLRDDSGEDNPHAWVSVELFIKYVENIRDGLAKADPAHADMYKNNAEQYIRALAALNGEMHAALDGLPHRDIVTFHEAFPYFAADFGLNIVADIEHEPGQAPSPSELADTIKLVRETGVTALFAEPQYAPAAAETIARETGATVYTLDPVVTGALKADAYEIAMRKNMETLVKALG